MEIIKRNIDLNKIKKYYGLYLLVLTELLFIAVVSLWGDKLYVTINDNLDSNLSLLKMFRDNNCWIDRTIPIPMLGGMSRDVLNCGYTLGYLIYWLFDTEAAYWLNYVVAIALSGVGFYCLGLSCRKIFDKNISPNLFCIAGILYIFIGIWPLAIIAFSLIPWWVFLVLEIYRTNKLWLALIFTVLIYNISGPLIGIFLIFYTFLFCVLVSVRDKKFNKTVFSAFGIIAIIFMIRNHSVIFNGLRGGGRTIKSLASSDGYVYNDSIRICIENLINIFLLKGTSLYHSGVYTLKYVALPVVLVFFLLINLERKQMKVGMEFLIIYDLLIAALFINACGMAFDEYWAFRKVFPFLSGFSFARFMWLSPFVIILCCLMVFHYLCGKGHWKSVLVIIIAITVSIILDVDVTRGYLTYNMVSVNYRENIRHQHIVNQARWDDYYARDLFEKIKSDIGYEGEWVVAYAFEPAILQYNGFKTLDGYYSNYPIEYKTKWEEVIMPVILANSDVAEYWQASNGQRAYVYSTRWLFPTYGNDFVEDGGTDMLINPEILENLGGQYVLSNVTIKNADELGFDYLGTWSDGNEYHINVYKTGR